MERVTVRLWQSSELQVHTASTYGSALMVPELYRQSHQNRVRFSSGGGGTAGGHPPGRKRVLKDQPDSHVLVTEDDVVFQPDMHSKLDEVSNNPGLGGVIFRRGSGLTYEGFS
jgi:hypothetical protein